MDTLTISKLSRHSKYSRALQKAFKSNDFNDVKKYDPEFLYHIQNHTYKAVLGKTFTGFLVLAPRNKRSRDGVLYLSWIFVLPEFRRKGIGTALFAAATQFLKNYKCHSIYFDIAHDLPDSEPFMNHMQKLAGSHGFNVIKKE